VVADCAIAQGGLELVGFLDRAIERAGTTEMGMPIHCPPADARAIGAQGVLLGTGDNRRRLALMAEARMAHLALPVVVHPTAWISPHARLGHGTVVMANATVQTNCRIGEAVIINTNASVDHDCLLADGVHVSPGAHLAGNVTVGEGSHIGLGASIIQGIQIGRDCLIAAGAVVIRDVPDGMRVAGVPAQPMSPRKAEK
jgi:sugar O-acyltransferase (sialic acid O-acetyltransferase NeuD family)